MREFNHLWCRLGDDARLPTRAFPTDAGADLYAASFENVAWTEPHNEWPAPCPRVGTEISLVATEITLHPGRCVLVHTNLSILIPEGYEGCLRGRSGLAFKQGVVCLHIGTIDPAYRNTLDLILKNESGASVRFKKSDRVGQIVFSPVVYPQPIQTEALPVSDRGNGGYGSSGR